MGEEKDTLFFDVLIIGTGIAGLAAAFKLAGSNCSVGIITRDEKPENCNTNYAQGGIIFHQNQERSINELFKKDVQNASSFTSYDPTIDTIIENSGDIIKEVLLKNANTEFQRNDNGDLSFTQEAAHSMPRILYSGDYTGRTIQLSMLNYLNDKEKCPNINFLTSHTAVDLITPNHHGVHLTQRIEPRKVVGAYVFDQTKETVKKIMAKKTILATGGIGALYLHHTNSEGARGDGHAMASRAGASVTNMEFIQFHPTTFYGGSGHRRFLISEAVRGEGAKLINAKGDYFMQSYHEMAELAPRDVVARAILNEIINHDDDCVYLDITHRDEDYLKNRFPTIFSYCLDHKINMAKDLIPVVPAAHYSCGGVKTDLNGETTLSNLFAVGEVACTGLHGANRLASTSLLEGLTFGYLAATKILNDFEHENNYYPSNSIFPWKDAWKDVSEEIDLALVHQDRMTIKQTMWNYIGLERTEQRLNRGSALFGELQDEIKKFYKHAKLNDELIGIRNSVEVAFLVLNASIRNKESVGCFYRKS
ncbi:FAD-binding protein [Bacteriovoracaceae bacterium]|nr:FAD-binding protein [Bacteriovoracaceae bacterium]